MQLPHNHQRHWLKEARLLRFAGIDDLQKLTTSRREVSTETMDFNFWKHTPDSGRDDLFDYFASHQGHITLETLQTYCAQNIGQINSANTPNHIVLEIDTLNKTKEDPTKSAAERASAERKLTLLIEYLEKQLETMNESQKKLLNLRAKDNPDVPNVTESIFVTAKEHIGAFASGFMDAPIEQKAVMIAGVAATVYLVKGLLKAADKNETAKKVKNFLGKLTGIGIAGTVAVMGYEAANNTFEKTYGRPLTNFWGNGDWFPSVAGSQQSWEKAKMADEFARVYDELRDMDIPVDKMQEIAKDNKERYAFGIANLATMQGDDFLKMYQKYNNAGIPEGAPEYPVRPFGKDYLTPLERQALVKDMGEAIGLIDQSGKLIPIKPEDLKKTISWFAIEKTQKERKDQLEKMLDAPQSGPMI